jgi:hypothetical protein
VAGLSAGGAREVGLRRICRNGRKERRIKNPGTGIIKELMSI